MRKLVQQLLLQRKPLQTPKKQSRLPRVPRRLMTWSHKKPAKNKLFSTAS